MTIGNVKNKRLSLEQESKNFVDKFPDTSNFLAEESLDPDINRTLDALTYLYALFEYKLEQEHLHLTYSLMSVLLPNYLQITPSITILEFFNSKSSGRLIAKGTQIYNKPQNNNPSCTFSIARDIWVSPFTIGNISKSSSNRLNINFNATNSCYLFDELCNLRIYCGSDLYSGFLLYLYFLEYKSNVTIVVNDHEYLLSDLGFQSNIFSEDEAILVYPDNIFNGYRLLHEYFCYPEGLLFFSLSNIPNFIRDIKTCNFELRIKFTQNLPIELSITSKLLRTNCVPAINLFYKDFEPTVLDGTKIYYPLIVSHGNDQHYEFFDVTDVVGYLNNEVRYYSKFESFHHEIAKSKGGKALYYRIEQKQECKSNKLVYSISFVRSDESNCIGQQEIVSISGLCSNRDLAQNLKIGTKFYLEKTEQFSAIEISNITYPSKVIRPNLSTGQQWITISALSFNYLSLLNKNSLQQLLQNYNFVSSYSRRATKKLELLIQGITEFTTLQCKQLYRDIAIEGQKSTIYLDNSAFYNDGEMYLFGTVMANFYAQCTPVNSFHFLEVVNSVSKEAYKWQMINS